MALQRDIGDVAVYIDADPEAIEDWYVARFQDLVAAAADDPSSFYRGWTDLDPSAVADLGRDIAGDATNLSARRKGDRGAGLEINEGLPQGSGGRKEYKDDEGKVTKVGEWFG